jgi:hypothetical protein
MAQIAINASNLFLALTVICAILYVFFYVTKKAYLKEYFNSGSNKPSSVPPQPAALCDDGRPCNLVTNFCSDGVTTCGNTNYGARNAVDQRTQIDEISNNNSGEVRIPSSGESISMSPSDTPYARQPIDDVDDYEYNMVYMNESNTALSKDLRQKLMRQYPMHWTSYPPSSSQFQAGYQGSFQNATQDVPDDAVPYQNISGSTMSPPDMAVLEKEERKILQTYKPEFPPKGVMYDERDATKLIKKIYDAKGLIPQIKHKPETNVYEIVGTRRKNETVVYEDDVQAPASRSAVESAGENTIQVPSAVTGAVASSNPWQYTAWTPGLERVFAPSEPTQDWING